MEELPFFNEEFIDMEMDIKSEFIITKVNSIPLANTPFIAPYVPVNLLVCEAAIKFANIQSIDTLVDLGCGDARILAMALESIPSPKHVIGVEYDELLVAHCQAKHPAMEIIHADMFTIDLDSLNASVAILYLLPTGLGKLSTLLFKWLNTHVDRRVITIGYGIPNWIASNTLDVPMSEGGFMGGSENDLQTIFYYTAESCK
ncbi:hypothetical protein BC833DRAFT_576398 [Globomyces pollinis-pini]|nr:hypothetical protein BC833DRAFT_576398 [Globomyces pollinis-pini]